LPGGRLAVLRTRRLAAPPPGAASSTGIYVQGERAFARCGDGAHLEILDAAIGIRPGAARAAGRMAPIPAARPSMKRILILGVNGFIGHHLSRAIIDRTDWEIHGMDMQVDRIGNLVDAPRFHFFEGDITINREWIEYHVKKCDVVLPLVAIATPAMYVREPLRVFELD